MKTAALLLLLFALIGNASARHHRSSIAADPGTFDYYLLSLSWSPAFCLGSPGAAECGGPRRFGFIVHGLWPQNEKGWPEYCNVHQQVPDSVVNGIFDLMPARGLIYHEWSAHGTCSGLGSADYFALVRSAYNSIAIPAEFSAISQPLEEAPDAIVKAFLRANPRLTPDSIAVTCSGQDLPRLREVHICLDRTLNPRACSADAGRGACRAAMLIVPPLR
ncbi:MAG: ribonuclease T2 [Pseudomonadota bacterium]|nr:ribonuclease T2 [Pseudomonadota bacterium]